MRIRTFVLIFCLSTQLVAHTSRNKQQFHPDPDYSSALQAADRFLHAWQTQDHEAGIMMLSDHARQHSSPEQLQEFFSPSSEAAFELEHGKRRNRIYEFPVVLFGTVKPGNRRLGKIAIIKTGKDDWAVDSLP